MSISPFPFKLPMLLDGATGTNLMLAGMPQGVCVEQWVSEHPDVIGKIQSAFIAAGSDAIYAPTFAANTAKLSHYHLEDQEEALNTALVGVSKDTVAKSGKSVLVGGDMSPTGLFTEPFGDTTFMELIDIYAQQAFYLKKAGADFLVLETMMSLSDCRAGVLGARQSGLPIFVTLTVDENGKTLSGTDLLAALVTLQGLGACAIGLNCSCGPDLMAEQIAKIAPYARVPLIGKPNAGKPDVARPGHYDLDPEQMAEQMCSLLDAGAEIIGGCCGSSPEHIAAMRKVLDTYDFAATRAKLEEAKQPDMEIAACETESFLLGEDLTFSPEVECSVDMVDDLLDMADEGYSVITVRINSLDDAYWFSINCHMAKSPICFVSENEEALERALLLYNGVALVDSQVEDISKERLREIADAFGAIVY